MADFIGTSSINWGATGNIGVDYNNAVNISLVQNPGYTNTGYVKTVKVKFPRTTWPVLPTGAKLFLIRTDNNTIIDVSEELLPAVDSGSLITTWNYGKAVSVPFRVGIAFKNGGYECYTVTDPAQPVSHTISYSTAIKFANMPAVGSTWSGGVWSTYFIASEVVFTLPPNTVVEHVNWGATGVILTASAASKYVFTQSIGYTRAGYLSSIKLKCSTASITSCKLFLVDTATRKVIAVSPPLTVVKGIADWTDGVIVTSPFLVGIAPINGAFSSFTTKDPSQIGDNFIYFTNAISHASVGVGASIPTDNWGTAYQLASKVTYKIDAQTTNYEGFELEVPVAIPKYRNIKSARLDDVCANQKEARIISGSTLDESLTAYRLINSNEGLFLEPLEFSAKSRRYFSNHLDEVKTGLVSARTSAAHEPSQVKIGLKSNNLAGVLVGKIGASSNAEHRFTLLVTATHQYKSRLVSIASKFRGVEPLIGKTRLIISGDVVSEYQESDANINQVDYSVTPLMLANGDNDCRIEYLYPNGSTEHIPFRIFKEDNKRIVVERTFKDYDGGYNGIRSNPSIVADPIVYPCFMVPEGSSSSLIKTTDYTSIPLTKYTGLQGIQIDANGVKVLASFDKGSTWKSLVDGVWQTVDLVNIAAVGMSEELINSTVFAKWTEIFKPTSLDFAILMDNLSSDYASGANEQLLFSSYVYGSSVYSVPVGMAATKVEYAINGYNSPSYTFTASYAEYLDDVKTYGVNTGGWGSPYAYSGTRVFGGSYPNRPNKFSTSYGGWYDYKQTLRVYGAPYVSYIKSINVQITPSLKTGYAFII